VSSGQLAHPAWLLANAGCRTVLRPSNASTRFLDLGDEMVLLLERRGLPRGMHDHLAVVGARRSGRTRHRGPNFPYATCHHEPERSAARVSVMPGRRRASRTVRACRVHDPGARIVVAGSALALAEQRSERGALKETAPPPARPRGSRSSVIGRYFMKLAHHARPEQQRRRMPRRGVAVAGDDRA